MIQTREVPHYSLTERNRRWNLARTLMRQEGLDALLVYGDREGTGPAPFAFDNYFTNDRPGATVLFTGDDDPISFVPLPMNISDHFESSLRGEDVWIAPEHMRFPRHPDVIAGVLKERGLDGGVIGVVGQEPYPPFYFLPPLPAALGLGLKKALPNVTFKPVAHRLAGLMLRQSDEELAVIRHAAAVGDDMARAMVEAAGPGVPESEVYAAGTAAALRAGVGAPGMLLWSGDAFVAWGPPSWMHRPQAPRILEEGDVLLAEVFTSFGMKETQHQVGIAIGDVHPEVERAAELARQAYDAGLEALRPGHRFGDVVEAMRAPIDAAGGSYLHPVVHGLNPFGMVSGVPLAIGQLPEAKAYDVHAEIPPIMHELVLEPGMTFAFEPNCALGRRSANIGGTVIVGEDAAIELNPFTAQLLRAQEPATAMAAR
jgi:Xaa-Pro aminopeptidase